MTIFLRKMTLLKSFLSLVGVVIVVFVMVIFIIRHLGFQIEHKWPDHQFKRDSFEMIAHRGGGLEAPENTIIAFDHTINISSDFILEMDVHLTKDMHLAVIHDDTVDRTTEGAGNVNDMTLEELKQLDAGWHYQDDKGEYIYRGQGVQIPSLREILLRYPHQRMTIELKHFSKKAAQTLIDLIEELRAFERIAIASYSHQMIEYIRSQRLQWIFVGTPTQMYQSLILLNMFLEPIDPITADAYYIPEVSMGIPVLSQRLLNEMHRRGKPVFVWTVNEEDDMKRLMDSGVDGIITDRPSVLFELTKAINK